MIFPFRLKPLRRVLPFVGWALGMVNAGCATNGGEAVLPAAALLESATQAACAVLGEASPVQLEDVSFQQPLRLPVGQTRRVQTLVKPADAASFTFEIHSRAAESQLFVAAEGAGLRSMREDGERLVEEGVTSAEEVMRVTRE